MRGVRTAGGATGSNLTPDPSHLTLMIIDLQRFVAAERAQWSELEKILDRLEREPNATMSLEQLTRFHLLHERAAADLAKITTFSAEPETRRYLEMLVARGYGEIHETRERRTRLAPWKWFFHTLPQTFRRQVRAFYLSSRSPWRGARSAGSR